MQILIEQTVSNYTNVEIHKCELVSHPSLIYTEIQIYT